MRQQGGAWAERKTRSRAGQAGRRQELRGREKILREEGEQAERGQAGRSVRCMLAEGAASVLPGGHPVELTPPALGGWLTQLPLVSWHQVFSTAPCPVI